MKSSSFSGTWNVILSFLCRSLGCCFIAWSAGSAGGSKKFHSFGQFIFLKLRTKPRAHLDALEGFNVSEWGMCLKYGRWLEMVCWDSIWDYLRKDETAILTRKSNYNFVTRIFGIKKTKLKNYVSHGVLSPTHTPAVHVSVVEGLMAKFERSKARLHRVK